LGGRPAKEYRWLIIMPHFYSFMPLGCYYGRVVLAIRIFYSFGYYPPRLFSPLVDWLKFSKLFWLLFG
jgi:hypothetical protein